MTAATLARPDVTVADLKATTDQTSLTGALAFILTTINKHGQIPVLAGVLLEGGASLTASGFDYEVSATETFAGTGTGRVLVDATKLHGIVKSLDKGCPIDLAVKADRFVLTGDGVTYTLPLLPLEEYPQLPGTTGQVPWCSIGPDQLAGIVDTAVAAGRDGTLPVLTGVRFEAALAADGKSTTLVTVATDRYRLGVYDTGLTVSKKLAGHAMLLPAYVVEKVRKSFKAQVSLSCAATGGEGVAFFTDGVRTLSARLLDGEFPKYRALLPDSWETTVTVNAKALTKGVKQVALMASRTSPVRLTLADGIVLEADDSDGNGASKSIEATVAGDSPLTMAFNPAYLLEGIAAVGTEMVEIRVLTPTKPAVLVGVDRPEYRYLVMPVRLAV